MVVMLLVCFFNINIANDMESSKLGDDTFDEHDIFSPPTFEEKIYFDDTLPPIYDDSAILVPPTMEDIMIIVCLLYLMRIKMIATLLNLLPLLLIKLIMLMWRVIILCMRLMIRMLYVIVILLSLLMLLLKVIMREENMVVEIFMVLKHLSIC